MRKASLVVLLMLFGLVSGFLGPASAALRLPGTIVGLPAWDRVPTPKTGDGSAEMRGVQAFGPNDVWSVGHAGDRTLTEHWNGSTLAVVPSPNIAGLGNILEDADGILTNDVWAVGHADVTSFLGSKSLALHWDGTSWTRIPTPNLGRSVDYNNLTGVAAVASDDAWAVGTLEINSHGTAFKAIIQHWNGSRWSLVPNSCGLGLSKIDARTPTDIWAVGGSDACHWDGTSWTRFAAGPPPNPQAYIDLIDVTAVSATDAWAVGQEIIECGESVCFSGEIQHWDGQKWRYVTNVLSIGYGVDAVAANDIWSVGPGPSILHYDGQTWSQVPSGIRAGELWGVEASGAQDIWAAGDKVGSTKKTLIEHAPSASSGAVVGGTNVSHAVVSWFGPETGSVETDQFGDYQVGGLAEGTYLFTVAYGGCQPDSANVVVPAGRTIGQNFRLNC